MEIEIPQPCFWAKQVLRMTNSLSVWGQRYSGVLGMSPPRAQGQLLWGHTRCPLWLPPPLLSTAPGLCASAAAGGGFL